MIGRAIFNRAPLPPNRLAPLPLGAIKPEGWLLEQLQIQADGLTGRLATFWPDVKDTAWLGKDGDAWERAPYYLDGLLPLAYLLSDEALMKVANEFVEWALASQDDSGQFGPKANDDWWPRMVMLKALQQYFTATGDKRVLTFMDKYFRYQLQTLAVRPLKEWACARAGENMLMVLWFYNLTGMSYLLTLAKLLKEQSLDFTNHFHIFPNVRPMSKQRAWKELSRGKAKEEGLSGEDQPYYSREYHFSHVVNVAMGLKTPGIVNLFKSGFKEVTAFKVGWQKLMKYHGLAHGMFSGDEHLNGNSPVQGTELCAVVEAMYSLETLIGIGDDFGDELPDLLEKIAYNALPATFSKDMMAHQYVQQANQICASDDARPYYNNGSDANVFGLEPNFGCCTANMHQGWPKFVSSLWYATSDNGLASIGYAPCTVNFVAGGTRVRLRVETDYPFKEQVSIKIDVKRPSEFPLYLRIPGWAERAMLKLPDGELMVVRAKETACLRRKWHSGDTISMDLPMEPRVTNWYHQSAAVELGPLLMCYRPKENWSVLREHPIAPDYEVRTEDAWNYALNSGEPMKVVFSDEPARAFKHGDTVKVLAKACRAPGWGAEGASAAPPPIQPEVDLGEAEVIELTPYGNSALRISEFPVCGT